MFFLGRLAYWTCRWVCRLSQVRLEDRGGYVRNHPLAALDRMRNSVSWDNGLTAEWVAAVCMDRSRPLSVMSGTTKRSSASAWKVAVHRPGKLAVYRRPIRRGQGNEFELSILDIWMFRITEHHPAESERSVAMGVSGSVPGDDAIPNRGGTHGASPIRYSVCILP